MKRTRKTQWGTRTSERAEAQRREIRSRPGDRKYGQKADRGPGCALTAEASAEAEQVAETAEAEVAEAEVEEEEVAAAEPEVSAEAIDDVGDAEEIVETSEEEA